MKNRFQQYFDRRKVLKAVGSFDEAGLLRAVETGQKEILTILLSEGISPDCQNEAGQPALTVAIAHKQILSLTVLAQHGANLNHCNEAQQTPLMYAAAVRDKYSFHQLLELGADPNCTDQQGNTALMLAATAPSATFARELIEAGAEVDTQNHQGDTALLRATQAEKTAIVKALLEAGADPSIANVAGESPHTQSELPPRIKELLQDAKGDWSGEMPNFPLPQRLGSLLGGMLEEGLTVLNESDSLIELEERGKLMINQLTSDEQIATWIGQLEDTELQQEITWWLNLLVEVREILRKQQLLLQQNQWEETTARRNWQKQLLWVVQAYHQQLDEALQTNSSTVEP